MHWLSEESELQTEQQLYLILSVTFIPPPPPPENEDWQMGVDNGVL
jgi:hypothetical protein